jgi:hypothetical protein
MKQTRKKARCQCMPSCKNKPLPYSPFCSVHQSCGRKALLSGYEPVFNPGLYNKYEGIKEAQNCFAYAFDYHKIPKKCTKDKCPVAFTQPGRKSGYPKWSNVNGKRCPDLISRLIGDVKDIKLTSFENKCPANYSKIALVVDDDEDYHFYRQDSNSYWSHKPGASDVTRLDGTGRPIYDPQLASRYYKDSGLNYDEFCSYLCIPRNKNLRFKRGGTRRATRGKSRKSRRKTR